MKSNKTCGGLVDFKESIIFENEKDLPVINTDEFKLKCLKKYKYKCKTSDLPRKIINYQVKTYGKTLTLDDWSGKTKEDMKRVNHVRNMARYSKLEGRKSDEK